MDWTHSEDLEDNETTDDMAFHGQRSSAGGEKRPAESFVINAKKVKDEESPFYNSPSRSNSTPVYMKSDSIPHDADSSGFDTIRSNGPQSDYNSNAMKNQNHNPDDIQMNEEELSIRPEQMAYDNQLRVFMTDEILQQELERTVKMHEVETTDEIVVETKVTEVKTVLMQLSESGNISVSETTEVKTDTDMKETKKTKERDEVIMSHKTLDRKQLDVPQQSSPMKSPISPEFSDRSPRSEVFSPSFTPASSKVNRSFESDFLTSTSNTLIDVQTEPAFHIAVASYEPESDDVMSLHEGEKLEVLDERQEDWWLVRKVFDNREGLVPRHYLKDKDEFDQQIDEEIFRQAEKMAAESSKT